RSPLPPLSLEADVGGVHHLQHAQRSADLPFSGLLALVDAPRPDLQSTASAGDQAGIHRRAHPEVLWNRKRGSTPTARRADRRHGIPAASPPPLCRGPLPLLQAVLSPGGE